MQHSNNQLDAALLGKIVFARFLENPVPVFRRFVAQVESSAEFRALTPWVTVTCLADAQATHDTRSIGPHSASTLGEVRVARGRLQFFYHCESHRREYAFEEAELRRLRSCPEFPAPWAKALHRLRLINSRNRLTHAVVKALLAAQAEYLLCGQSLSLRTLTQAQMSANLRGQPGLPMVADAGRISRLVHGLSILLPSGKAIRIAQLFPSGRQTHCQLVDYVIKKEISWLEQGALEAPLSDQAIADILGRENGVRLSRRTVANIRHALAIPDCRRRSQGTNYLTATEGFSALVPLTQQALRSVVPADSGVYEIRSDFISELGRRDTNSSERRLPISDLNRVVYIGSAGDLRKRLSDHVRGSSGNDLLHRCIVDGASHVRYRMISEGWRWVERELYRIFCKTFGTPPFANRMSP